VIYPEKGKIGFGTVLNSKYLPFAPNFQSDLDKKLGEKGDFTKFGMIAARKTR
jgi:hypothetical protein